jgi:hypothetical protein
MKPRHIVKFIFKQCGHFAKYWGGEGRGGGGGGGGGGELGCPHYVCCLKCHYFIYINKLSLVGMKKREKYKENFDVSSEGPSSAVTRYSNSRRKAFAQSINITLILFRSLYQRKLVYIIGTTYTGTHS